jgi:hypothetical protein
VPALSPLPAQLVSPDQERPDQAPLDRAPLEQKPAVREEAGPVPLETPPEAMRRAEWPVAQSA